MGNLPSLFCPTESPRHCNGKDSIVFVCPSSSGVMLTPFEGRFLTNDLPQHYSKNHHHCEKCVPPSAGPSTSPSGSPSLSAPPSSSPLSKSSSSSAPSLVPRCNHLSGLRPHRLGPLVFRNSPVRRPRASLVRGVRVLRVPRCNTIYRAFGFAI